AADACLDALGTGAHRTLDRLLLRGTERCTLLQLISDASCDQTRIQIRICDLNDVEVYVLAGHLLQLLLQGFDVLTVGTDDNTRTSSADHDRHTVLGTLDFNS